MTIRITPVLFRRNWSLFTFDESVLLVYDESKLGRAREKLDEDVGAIFFRHLVFRLVFRHCLAPKRFGFKLDRRRKKGKAFSPLDDDDLKPEQAGRGCVSKEISVH
jgi:hypothetical protein